MGRLKNIFDLLKWRVFGNELIDLRLEASSPMKVLAIQGLYSLGNSDYFVMTRNK
jgi:hypothetical protein